MTLRPATPPSMTPFVGKSGRTARMHALVPGADGSSFSAELYTAINTRENPELRQQLQEGTLHQVRCPRSGETYALAVPVVLHDPARQLFVLVVPAAIRHQELELRRELLERLGQESCPMPAYVRQFQTVIGPEGLAALETQASAPQVRAETPAAGLASARSEVDARLERERQTQAQAFRREFELWKADERRRQEVEFADKRRELAEKAAELERQRLHLDLERQKFEAVTRTADEDEARAEKFASELAGERQSLEQLRMQLRAEQKAGESQGPQALETPSPSANLVASRFPAPPAPQRPKVRMPTVPKGFPVVMQASAPEDTAPEEVPGSADGPATPEEILTPEPPASSSWENMSLEGLNIAEEPEEKTNIIEAAEIFGSDHATQAPARALRTPTGTANVVSAEAPEPSLAEPAPRTRVSPYNGPALAARFDAALSAGNHYFVDGRSQVVRAGWRMDAARIERFASNHLDILVQYHVIEQTALAALTLVALDDDGHLVDSVGWPLDLKQTRYVEVLERLGRDGRLVVGLYDRENQRREAWTFEVQLSQNIVWLRERLERHIAQRPARFSEFSAVAETFVSEGFDRVGTMRHPFAANSFEDLSGASAVRLAAGIVGFWSTPEKLDYLVGNRSFPLQQFRRIQERVVRAAVAKGIGLLPELEAMALELGLAPTPAALVELLMANFAELCVGIRGNDLDIWGQFENWEALIAMAQSHDVQPDADVLELAQLSFNRAQELHESLEMSAVSPDELDQEGFEFEDAELVSLSEASDVVPEPDGAARAPKGQGDSDALGQALQAGEVVEASDAAEVLEAEEVEEVEEADSSLLLADFADEVTGRAPLLSSLPVPRGGLDMPDEDVLELDEAEVEESSDQSLLLVRPADEALHTDVVEPGVVEEAWADLPTMSQAALEPLLLDPHGRLRAALVLVERFDGAALQAVLEAIESMDAAEIASISEALSAKADTLEAELVRSLDSVGPKALVVLARALVSQRSTSALPVLLDALVKPASQGIATELAAVLAGFGERLLPALTRALKQQPVSPTMITLLRELDGVRPGTIEQFERDRSAYLREAARLARA